VGGTSLGYGTVFKMTPAGTLTTLYSFSSTDGANPWGGLIQASDGNLYGTTMVGGTNNHGTIFKITLSGTLNSLHSLKLTEGAQPVDGLVQATDGNFYGTTSIGGANNGGTVFEITPGGTLAALHSFCVQSGCTDGVNPSGGLIQGADGDLYGSTTSGGASNNGAVFRLAVAPAATLSPTSLSFANVPINTISLAKKVTVSNSGTALLRVSAITVKGSFTTSADTCTGTVQTMGKKCEVSITFTPTTFGTLSGTLIVADNASNSPQLVPLSGTSVEPAILTPVKATYAAQVLGSTSTSKTFTLINNQMVALSSIAITATGDFAVSATTCTTSLAAKSKCTINVTFMPTKTGTRTGSLSVSDSANNSPQAASLTGTGK